MEVAKISSKGQITIPVSVRNKLKLRTGDKIVILEEMCIRDRFPFTVPVAVSVEAVLTEAEELLLAPTVVTACR